MSQYCITKKRVNKVCIPKAYRKMVLIIIQNLFYGFLHSRQIFFYYVKYNGLINVGVFMGNEVPHIVGNLDIDCFI